MMNNENETPRVIAWFAGMPIDVTNDGPAMPEELDRPWWVKAGRDRFGKRIAIVPPRAA